MGKVAELMNELEISVSTLMEGMSPIEKEIYSDLLLLIRDLDLDAKGNILNNLRNIKILGKIRRRLSKIIFSDKYKDDVYNFTQSFHTVSTINNQYFASLVDDYKPKAVLKAVKELAIESTIDGLTEQGINSNVIEGIKGVLKTNITTGAEYKQLTTQLKDFVLGTDKGGAMTRYARTYVTDAINQYSAEHIKIVTDDLGLKWFSYVGSLRETSRDFCKALVHKRWVHVSEFPAILKGNIAGNKVSLAGVKENTTPENFQSLRGGWNCNHQLIAVLPTAVPKDVREKVENNIA